MKPKAWALKPVKLVSSQTDYEERSDLPLSRMREVTTVDSTNVKMDNKEILWTTLGQQIKKPGWNGQIPCETHITKVHSRKNK